MENKVHKLDVSAKAVSEERVGNVLRIYSPEI